MNEWCSAVAAAATAAAPPRAQLLALFDIDGRAVPAWCGKPLEAASLLLCAAARLERPRGEAVTALAAMLRRLPALRAAAAADSGFAAAAAELIDEAAVERPAPLGACAAAAAALRLRSELLIAAATAPGALSAAPVAALVEFMQYLQLMVHEGRLVLPPALWREVAAAAAAARFSRTQSSAALLAVARLAALASQDPPPCETSGSVWDAAHVRSPADALDALRADFFENALPQLNLMNPVDTTAVLSGMRAVETAGWSLTPSEASELIAAVVRKRPATLQRMAEREWALECIGPESSYHAVMGARDTLDGDVAARVLLFLAERCPAECLHARPVARGVLLAAVQAAAALHQLRGAYARRGLRELPRLGITSEEHQGLFKALRQSAGRTLARRLALEAQQLSKGGPRGGKGRTREDRAPSPHKNSSSMNREEALVPCPKELVDDMLAFADSMLPHDARTALKAIEILRWKVPEETRALLVASAAFNDASP
jgi:hypothetical protein